MEPRTAAAAPPRARQHTRRSSHDSAAAIAVASGPLGILALGGSTTRRFAGALPDPHGAARGSPSLPGRRDRRRARRSHRFRRAVSAFWPKPEVLAGTRSRSDRARPRTPPLLRLALRFAVARDAGARGGHGRCGEGRPATRTCARGDGSDGGQRARPGPTRVQFALAMGSVHVPLHSLPLAAYAAAAAGAASGAQSMDAELRRRPTRGIAPSRAKFLSCTLGRP